MWLVVDTWPLAMGTFFFGTFFLEGGIYHPIWAMSWAFWPISTAQIGVLLRSFTPHLNLGLSALRAEP